MKIIVDTKYYNLQEDKRLLVPFIHENTGLIGFINRRGHVIIPHSYEHVYDDFYDKEDVVRVALADSKGNLVRTIISANGKVLFKEIYKEIMMSVDRQRFVVENLKGQWAVVDREEKVIVPYGKYDWIDGFRNGFARVKQGKTINGKTGEGKLWGIINADGKEILPVVFPNIHSFVDELNDYTTIKKDYITVELFEEEEVESIYTEGVFSPLPCPSRVRQISFESLNTPTACIGLVGINLASVMRKEKEKYLKRIEEYNKDLPEMRKIHKKNLYNKPDYDPYDNREWLHRYDGSTDDAYEGDPDARWNTD
jgi:hypothetical protein